MPKKNELHTLKSVPLSKIIKEEYRTYQIYTLMDRAIPYLQDGLKPGQRRILYTLFKNQSKGLMKVSAATGLVLTLHPHGPASIESAIVNLAQDYTFSNNYPLIDKKGYFGERMETQAAASRYIECKLGEVAKILLFDDMNQVEMISNYDDRAMEPVGLLPKLPLMLLNGAEGIGTGFSSSIPSFNYKDIIKSMISYISKKKVKKIKPYVQNYSLPIEIDKKGKFIFRMSFEKKGGQIFINELPRGYDASKIYRHLSKFVEEGFLKDYIDSSVGNDVKIELLFKKGKRISLQKVEEEISISTYQVPNYTLINEKGVKIFNNVESIIEIFTEGRLKIVKRRYELFCIDLKKSILQNNEIIKFIKQKEYEVATKTKNRKSFVEYLVLKKYIYSDYLADMAIYRMTKEEVSKRRVLIEKESEMLSEYIKIAKSDKRIAEKTIEELLDVDQALTEWKKRKDKNLEKLLKKIETDQRKLSEKKLKSQIKKLQKRK